jgi:hypothetical protein
VSRQPLPIRWRLAVREHGDLSPNARLFAFVFSTYADNATGSATPALSTIARGCGYSADTARRAQHELRRAHFLDIKSRPGQTNVLTLCLPLAHLPGVRPGVPLAQRPITPGTRATQTLKNSKTPDGNAVNGGVPPAPRPKQAEAWVRNGGWDDPHPEATLRDVYSIGEGTELERLLSLARSLREAAA